jgi:hypothetical protein
MACFDQPKASGQGGLFVASITLAEFIYSEHFIQSLPISFTSRRNPQRSPMTESLTRYRTIYKISDRPGFSGVLFRVDIQSFNCHNASLIGVMTTICVTSLSVVRTPSVTLFSAIKRLINS